MQILIACAKIMTDNIPVLQVAGTEPMFQAVAERLAMQLAAYSPDELQTLLHVNRQIARENWRRYQDFFDPATRVPAVFAYDGMVYRKLAPETMSRDELLYANDHLFIGSFLYGLLRPLDLINGYRLEGKVSMPCTDHKTLFNYWKPILTDRFIEKVKADDGILVNLASSEFKDLFEWKRIERELTVITPEFKVNADGRLKTVVIYAKMCRGAMTRWILQNRLQGPSAIPRLADFTYEGFRHTIPTTSAPARLVPYTSASSTSASTTPAPARLVSYTSASSTSASTTTNHSTSASTTTNHSTSSIPANAPWTYILTV